MDKIAYELWFYRTKQSTSTEAGFGVFGGILILLLIGLSAAIMLPNLFTRNVKPYMAEAKVYLSAMNRSQHAYFLEHNHLADSFEPLEISPNVASNEYSYYLEVLGTQAFHYAENPDPKLASYVGAVFIVESEEEPTTQDIATILCGEPRQKKADLPPIFLQKPVLHDNIPQCPPDMELVSRSPEFENEPTN